MRQILISVFLLTASACGNDDTTPAASAPIPAFEVFPSTINIGINDQGKPFAAPILITGGKGVTFSSDAKNIARVSGNDTLASVSGLRAGTTQLTLTSGTSTATVAVTVTRYSAANLGRGETSWAQLKCKDCHPSVSDTSPSGIAHHTDDEVFLAITQGVNPEGGDITLGSGKHVFAADRGIVGFLRSLPALGVPKQDN